MEAIKVLTYNLCWGCMVADKTSKFDNTALPLATTCETLRTENNNQHVCLQNIAIFIDKTCQDYDFIGTQENGNWVELNNASTVLKGMGYVAHLTDNGKVKFVTYYNTNKYTLLGGKAGDLIIAKSSEQGRPYQILFLEDNKTKNNIIFVNVHNSHNNGRKRILENFKALSNGFIANGSTTIDLKSDYGNSDISSLIANKEFEVIMTGDHNDSSTKESNFHQGIKPFANSTYPNLKDINLSTQKHIPPKSCCDTTRAKKNKDFRYGDYILISDNLEFIMPNKIPDLNYDSSAYPTSDHLPVIAEIKYKSITPVLAKQHGCSSKTLVKQESSVKPVTSINYKLINFINYI
jgi:endonuclease/exonuclease/phosphatase family metal-dependent hydrolase